MREATAGMQTPEPRTVALLLFLLAGAAASTFLLVFTRGEDIAEDQPKLSFAYYLDDTVLRTTGPDGEVMFEVRTERAEQSNSASGVEIRYIEMDYGPPGGIPWRVRADRGRISPDASIISLTGNVVAVAERRDAASTVIRTEEMSIDPETQTASSSRRVVLEFGDRLLNATGMEANLATNSLKLLANVNGKFTP